MKITKAQLKQIIKEELEAVNEVTDDRKWATITMGARIPFEDPRWRRLSGGGKMRRLAKALENPEIRQEFEETYNAIKDIERAQYDVYQKGKSIVMSFFEKLKGAI
jgi:hypothetical protein